MVLDARNTGDRVSESVMTTVKDFLLVGVAVTLLSGCTDHRLNRSDEEGMMVYRECMSEMPPQVNSADMSATVSSSPTANQNTSIAANAQTRQEQSQQILFMKQAGWEEE